MAGTGIAHNQDVKPSNNESASVRVLLITDSVGQVQALQAGLNLAGHELIDTVTPQAELAGLFERTGPTLILLQVAAPTLELFERVQGAMGTRVLPLVVFAGEGSSQAIEHAVRAGAASYVVGEVQPERVPAILQVAMARFEFIRSLRAELGLVRQQLTERKLVERAKGLLMKARRLDEEEAYHTLRRLAMERNRRLADVARSVIEMADLLG